MATSLSTITTEGRLRGIIHLESGMRVVLQLYPSSSFMSVSVSVSVSVSTSEVELGSESIWGDCCGGCGMDMRETPSSVLLSVS